MKLTNNISLFFIALIFVSSCTQKSENENSFNADDMIIRISEIEIPPDILDFKVAIGYKSIDKINFYKILITKDNQAIVTATLNDENALYRKTQFILWKRDT